MTSRGKPAGFLEFSVILKASKFSYFGLYALRAQGAGERGIAVAGDNRIVDHKGMGLVSDVFDIRHVEQLRGLSAIGHVRYSTTGSSILSNAQPFVIHHRKRAYAVAHNGNLVNAHSLKNGLKSGIYFPDDDGQRGLSPSFCKEHQLRARTRPG